MLNLIDHEVENEVTVLLDDTDEEVTVLVRAYLYEDRAYNADADGNRSQTIVGVSEVEVISEVDSTDEGRMLSQEEADEAIRKALDYARDTGPEWL